MVTKKKLDVSEDFSIPTLSDESTDLGEIKINHSVVAGIVRLATKSIEGVVSVGGGGVVEGITDFFSKKESERGVKVSETEPTGGYQIEVRVVLEFGVDLAKTGFAIQESIRDQILAMTGNPASKIDVIIDDIKMDASEEKDELSDYYVDGQSAG